MEEYRRFHGRLAQFKHWDSQPKDWEEYWSSHSVEQELRNARIGGLSEYGIFARYLPTDLPILEAGCGIGKIVAALAARGYMVQGVDYVEPAVRRLHRAAPGMEVWVGDIRHLGVADNSYGGYISLGVLEHDQIGPLDGLREARRVLHSQGFAFVAVPYLNPRRERLLRHVEEAESDRISEVLRFYQYYFSIHEFTEYLETAGFKVVNLSPLRMYWGLVLHNSLFGWLHDRGFLSRRLRKRFWHWCQQAPITLKMRWAHMMLYICKPA